MILRHILLNKNSSNIAHTLLSTIKSYDANPPEKIYFLITLMLNAKLIFMSSWRSAFNEGNDWAPNVYICIVPLRPIDILGYPKTQVWVVESKFFLHLPRIFDNFRSFSKVELTDRLMELLKNHQKWPKLCKKFDYLLGFHFHLHRNFCKIYHFSWSKFYHYF